MEWIKEKVKEWELSKFDWVLVSLMVVGGMLIVLGIIGGRKTKSAEVEYLTADSKASETEMIWVDISGAIKKPGVYQLEKGKRVKDVLVLAGGLDENADRGYLEEVLNLAEEVKDGQKIYIPRQGNDEGEVLGGLTDNLDGLINVNTASLSELKTLPGVGPARAQSIIDNRRFSKVEELLSKGVLPENVYEKIKDKVSVY